MPFNTFFILKIKLKILIFRSNLLEFFRLKMWEIEMALNNFSDSLNSQNYIIFQWLTQKSSFFTCVVMAARDQFCFLLFYMPKFSLPMYVHFVYHINEFIGSDIIWSRSFSCFIAESVFYKSG